ncbi:MAG: AAA family ATPase [Desulfomonilaceae bacterium]
MLKYFDLAENPFSVSPNPRYCYLSNLHRGILAKVDYVVEHRQGLTVIYGDVGTGKTSLARLLMDRLAERNYVVFITNPNFKSEMHMVKAISSEFGLAPKRSLFAQMEALQANLIEMYAEGKNPVVIIDEAQLMRGKQFEIVRQLSNFETNDTKLLQIILTGQMELRNKLRMKKALMSRIVIASTLQAFSLDEMADMILFRLKVAGGNGNIFISDCLDRVYEHSKGIPREAIKLCGLALKRAHLQEEKQITAEMIDLTHKEVAA